MTYYMSRELSSHDIELLTNIGYVVASTYASTWGLLIPGETKCIWEHQVDGICCHHVYVEGIFIPLRDLTYIKKHKVPNSGPFHKEHKSLLYDIAEANLHNKDTSGLWDEVRMKTGINFKCIDNSKRPIQSVANVEGLQWIVINEEIPGGKGNVLKLGNYVGKPIILIYPNSD